MYTTLTQDIKQFTSHKVTSTRSKERTKRRVSVHHFTIRALDSALMNTYLM